MAMNALVIPYSSVRRGDEPALFTVSVLGRVLLGKPLESETIPVVELREAGLLDRWVPELHRALLSMDAPLMFHQID